MFFRKKVKAIFLSVYYTDAMTDAFALGKSYKLTCEICNYVCSRSNDLSKHYSTRKHQKNAEYLHNSQAKFYECECGRKYKHRQSLFSHKKNCQMPEIIGEPIIEPVKPDPMPTPITNDMILNLIEQNQELQKQLVELSKQGKTVNNTTNNTMNNNQFNINVFLNENCKDALNIAEFIESLELTVNDLEQTGKLGYAQGISRIFIKALKQIDVNMRPLHCTDMKRETVYIKDHDIWEKEDTEKTKLRNVLKQIARKNLKMMPKWQEENPEFQYLDTPENDEFLQISLSALGPEYKEDQEKQEDKIIRTVLKEVVLDKKSESILNIIN